MHKIKNIIYKNKILLSLYYSFKAINNYFKINIIKFIKDSYKYVKDIIKMKKHPDFKINYLYPCINDNTSNTPLNIDYFYQDTWAINKIFKEKPKKHYDIGSNAKTIGILSQFTNTYMVDIRPIPVKLKGLNFIKGDICNLPFKNNSIKSLSSLCVIEHIGLGRYGDKLDAFGSEKAIKEIIRVVKKSGNIYISVPVFKQNTIFFNAHRAFTRKYILKQFNNCKLIEEKYIYNREMKPKYIKNNNTYGTGLFWFKKN